MKSASAYLKQNKLYMQGYSKTTVGLSRLDGKVFTPEIQDIFQIGNDVKEVLHQTKVGIPHPSQQEFKEQNKNDPLLIAADVKTWNTLMKYSKSITIDFKDNKMFFIPTKFGGTSGSNKGYHELEDKIITTNDLSPENLGRLLLEAFNRCE